MSDDEVLWFFSELQDAGLPGGDIHVVRSDEMFRLAMDSSALGMAVLGPAGHWIRVNPTLCGILGRTEEELAGTTFHEITHPDDLPADEELLAQLVEGELDSYQLDKRYSRPDGTWVWVRLSVAVARHDSGHLAYVVAQVEDLTRERRVARELAAQDQRFRLLADGAEDVIVARIRVRPELRVEYLSRGSEAITGRPAADLYADPSLLGSFVHPDDRPALQELLDDPDLFRHGPVSIRALRPDGTVVWLQARGEAVRDDDGAIVGFEALAWDVTARREAGDALAASERRFRALVEHAADAVALRDADGVIRYVSPAVTRITGYAPEDLLGTTLGLRLDRDQRPALQAAIEESTAVPGGAGRAEVRTTHRDGSDRWVEVTVSDHLDDPDIGGQIINVHDVTQRRIAENELAYQAAFDGLTGLPNRSSVQRRLTLELAEDPAAVGVLFVDLSGLKTVNDTLGHAKGDAVLVAVARRIFTAVGNLAEVGRFGGAEFAVVATGLAPHELVQLAERIVREIDHPITAPDGGHVYLAASVGIALGHDGDTAEQLLAGADLAMYDVKRRTGRGVRLFDSALADHATARLALERDLRGADLDRDLRDHYQPVVHLGTGCVVAAEALLRWQHPERGLVQPADFIPVAEETGLIDELGLWVLAHACQRQVEWADRDLTVGVNLSPRQLYDPDLPSRVAELVTEAGARPDRLLLEVTESALVEDRVARPALSALKDLGVGLALDDFGTGYSSLTRLRQYPFDTVKIDRSFVAEMTRSPHDLAIVRHVINLAHALGMGVAAEGVETEHQLRLLAEAGADTAQGYYLGRPAPAGETLGPPP